MISGQVNFEIMRSNLLSGWSSQLTGQHQMSLWLTFLRHLLVLPPHPPLRFLPLCGRDVNCVLIRLHVDRLQFPVSLVKSETDHVLRCVLYCLKEKYTTLKSILLSFFNYRYHYQWYSAHRLHIKVIRQLSLYILKTGVHSHLQKYITIKKNMKWRKAGNKSVPKRRSVSDRTFPAVQVALRSCPSSPHTSTPTPHLHFLMKITWTSYAHLITTLGSGLPCDWSVCMAPPFTHQSFSGCFCPSVHFACGYFFFLQFSHFLTADVLYTAEASRSFKSLFLCEFSHRIVKKKKGEGDRISQQFHTSPSVVPHPDVKQLSRCVQALKHTHPYGGIGVTS